MVCRSAVFGVENLSTSDRGLECLSVTGGRYACSDNFRRSLDQALMYNLMALGYLKLKDPQSV